MLSCLKIEMKLASEMCIFKNLDNGIIKKKEREVVTSVMLCSPFS
jgi:hypothetical protein